MWANAAVCWPPHRHHNRMMGWETAMAIHRCHHHLVYDIVPYSCLFRSAFFFRFVVSFRSIRSVNYTLSSFQLAQHRCPHAVVTAPRKREEKKEIHFKLDEEKTESQSDYWQFDIKPKFNWLHDQQIRRVSMCLDASFAILRIRSPILFDFVLSLLDIYASRDASVEQFSSLIYIHVFVP